MALASSTEESVFHVYILSSGSLYYFFFPPLDCESMTTGHLCVLHVGCVSVCVLAHRHAWASLDVPCGGTGPSPAALAQAQLPPGLGPAWAGGTGPDTPLGNSVCYPEQAKKNPTK